MEEQKKSNIKITCLYRLLRDWIRVIDKELKCKEPLGMDYYETQVIWVKKINLVVILIDFCRKHI